MQRMQASAIKPAMVACVAGTGGAGTRMPVGRALLVMLIACSHAALAASPPPPPLERLNKLLAPVKIHIPDQVIPDQKIKVRSPQEAALPEGLSLGCASSARRSCFFQPETPPVTNVQFYKRWHCHLADSVRDGDVARKAQQHCVQQAEHHLHRIQQQGGVWLARVRLRPSTAQRNF